jgi:DNA-binding NtrC family response regulator
MRRDDRRLTILVVDDDRDLCLLLVEMLTEAGYTGWCSCDGESAWHEIQCHVPQLILSDIAMPRLDGLGLARRLADTGSAIPVILMSSGEGTGAAVSAAFVRKPFARDHLLACISQVLEDAGR